MMKEVTMSPKITLPDVYKFCTTFHMNTNYVLISYLNNVLIDSEKYLFDQKVSEDKLVSALKKAKCAIDGITDDELLVRNLESLLKKVCLFLVCLISSFSTII